MSEGPNTMSTITNMPSAAAHAAQFHGPDAEHATTLTSDAPSPPTERSHRGAGAQARTMPVPHPPYGPFVPVLLGALALLGWLGFQTHQLLNERQALQAAYLSQQQTVDNAGKLRASLDALAADTQRMADSGNPNARLLVDELRKRGITINPAASTPSASTLPAAKR
jgi:hypothetical protein